MEREEKKTYSVIGKVEIGTDEYRDLIEDVAKLYARVEDLTSKKYEEYCRANEAERKNKTAARTIGTYVDFVNSSELIKAEYIKFMGARTCAEE